MYFFYERFINKAQIGPLSFEFVSDRSLKEVDRKDQSETNSKLKGPIRNKLET